jgi:hypothetical protein
VEALESRDLPSGYTLGPLVQVSGPSPFADCQPPGTYGVNAETENFVAVDPANHRHVVAAWFQDFAVGIVTAATFDAGKTWQSAVVPGLTTCSGGDFPNAADPWVTFAANGDVYVSSVQNHFVEPGNIGPAAIRVSKSTNGGRTWGAPITLIEQGHDNDKPSITADPQNGNYIYAVWNRSSGDLDHGTGNRTMFTHSTDGGQTWEPARAIAVTGNDDTRHADQVLVQPDGSLVILSQLDVRHGNSTNQFVSAMRSTDRGLTWSEPVRGTQMFLPDAAIDPETGQKIDNGNPDFAADPSNGNLYAVWADNRFSGGQFNSIAFTMSSDGGLTWSAPVKINKTPTSIAAGNQEAFLPSIEVAANGVVGVTYYDLRNNTPAAGLPCDYWFIHGEPTTDLTNPANWANELRLTSASFDLETAPDAGGKGLFLGDYEGLAAAGNDFVPTWAMPHGMDLDSVFSRRIIAGAPLLAAAAGHNRQSATLSFQQVAGLLPEAIHRWQAAGVDTAALAGIDVRITDLGGTTLGLAAGHTIWLDDNAASWGWFVDPTPSNDSEFTTLGNQGEKNRMDLLTVLEHEVGHLLGREHDGDGVMQERLTAGTRLAVNREVDAGTPRYATDAVFALFTADEEAPWVGSIPVGRGRPKWAVLAAEVARLEALAAKAGI